MHLKDSKFDGRGGMWLSDHGSPKIAAQGSIQIGGRVIAFTLWHNDKPVPSPHYNITLNERQTKPEDVAWFKSLSIDSRPTSTQPAVPPHPDWKPPPKIVGRTADILIADDIAAEAAAVFLATPDDDIPF